MIWVSRILEFDPLEKRVFLERLVEKSVPRHGAHQVFPSRNTTNDWARTAIVSRELISPGNAVPGPSHRWSHEFSSKVHRPRDATLGSSISVAPKLKTISRPESTDRRGVVKVRRLSFSVTVRSAFSPR